ncbi:MAG TPA: Rieske (2Fe-2S) protein [Ktedonobacterales bacterium]|jgi:Rieske Fe-S protein|nr:Rieske (2Fe-2S) protein [Ktedonobacterales bacterium]
MTPRDDKSQSKRSADASDATGAGEDLRPASREEVLAANALDERVERMRAERRPDLSGLSPDEARMQVIAATLHAQAPGADEPDPDFVARLRQRLSDPTAPAQPIPIDQRRQSARRGVSRRGILAGGLGAVAAAAAGVAVGVSVDRVVNAPQPWPAMVPEGAGAWLPVASADSLVEGQVLRFTANSVVGFIRRTADGFAALSGACTHMGCFLDWNASARTYDCPCHGGRFTEAGAAAPSSPVAYRPLPKLQTRVEQGKVWVYVPSTSAVPDGEAPTTTPYSENDALLGED